MRLHAESKLVLNVHAKSRAYLAVWRMGDAITCCARGLSGRARRVTAVCACAAALGAKAGQLHCTRALPRRHYSSRACGGLALRAEPGRHAHRQFNRQHSVAPEMSPFSGNII
jgi:hypothetical protein